MKMRVKMMDIQGPAVVILSARPVFTFSAKEHHCPIAGT